MNLEDVQAAHVVFVQLCELVKRHVRVLFAFVLKNHVADILKIGHTKLVLRALFRVFQGTISLLIGVFRLYVELFGWNELVLLEVFPDLSRLEVFFVVYLNLNNFFDSNPIIEWINMLLVVNENFAIVYG